MCLLKNECENELEECHFYENHLKVKNMNLDYLEKVPFIRFQCKIFRSKRVLSFYRHQVSANTYRKLEIDGFKTKSWREGFFDVLKQIMNSILVIPIRRKRVKGIVINELASGFSKDNLGDDYLVDGKIVNKYDMVYYKASSNEPGRVNAYKEAKKQGLKTVNPSRFINLNKIFFYHLWFNFFCGFVCLFKCLIHSREMLPVLSDFLGESNYLFRMYSFTDAKLFLGHSDSKGVIPTLICNLFGVRTFFYPYSDLSRYENCEKQDIGYNDLFLWEKITVDISFSRNCCDNIYIIGCRFSNSYSKKPKNELRKKLDFPIGKKVVTFYDTSYRKGTHTTIETYEEFIKLIADYAIKNPEVFVVLKPKKNEIQSELLHILNDANVKILDNVKFVISDVICVSDVNVGMGVNTPTTIGLYCGIPGVNYDRTKNKCHPLSKNKEVTFDNKKQLFNQINNLLKDDAKIQNIPELDIDNVSKVDTLKILRNYVKKGEIDKKFRYKYHN